MYRSPDQNQRDDVILILHEALGDDYRRLSFRGILTSTHSSTKDTEICLRFNDNGEDKEATVADGKGAVDGMYKALMKHYYDFSSIRNLKLKTIKIEVDLPNSDTGTDAMVAVDICFCNDRQCAFFTDTSYSFTASSCKCLLKAVEFFF
tara:strand:+ start:22 stop:468 length:447 start_codon:yes stop_codon:yes gene_type:complete